MQVHPGTYWKRPPENVSWAELFQFVPAIDTTKVTPRQEQLIHDLRWIYAADRTFYRVGMELYRKKHPDFFTVYFRGVDEIRQAVDALRVDGGCFGLDRERWVRCQREVVRIAGRGL